MRKLQINSAQIFPQILLAMRGKPPLSTATHARGGKYPINQENLPNFNDAIDFSIFSFWQCGL